MWTKFGLPIHFGLLKAATLTNTKPEVVLSGRGCHLKKSIWRYFHNGLSDIDDIWQFDSKEHADYGNIIEIDAGSRIPIWRTFLFPKQKKLYFSRELTYVDDVWCDDRISLYEEVTSTTQRQPSLKIDITSYLRRGWADLD